MANPTAGDLARLLADIEAQLAERRNDLQYASTIGASPTSIQQQIAELETDQQDVLYAMRRLNPGTVSNMRAYDWAQNALGTPNIGAAPAGGMGGIPTGGLPGSLASPWLDAATGSWGYSGSGAGGAGALNPMEYEKELMALEQKYAMERLQASQTPEWMMALEQKYAMERLQAQLAQDWAMAEISRKQRQQEMAASVGQTIASLQTQAWETGLPWALPSGTQYAPGFGPGEAMAQMLKLGGAAYNPNSYRIAVHNPPSAEQMQQWVAAAMGQFGG